MARIASREDVAVQLVREAYDVLTNPESRVDVREWTKAAAAVLAPTRRHAVTRECVGRVDPDPRD